MNTKHLSIVAIVVVIAGFSYIALRQTPSANAPAPAASAEMTPAASVSPAVSASGEPSPTSTPASSTASPRRAPVPTKKSGTLPRMNLASCVASPASLSLAPETGFSIYNLDYTSRKVQVGDRVFTVAPQDYITVPAPAAGAVTVLCDGALAGSVNAR